MKKLNELINCEYDTEILGVVSDSREVREGYLFVAIKGYFADRYEYIDKAIENGAVAIIVDRKPNIEVDVPVIIVENINEVYLDVLRVFHNHVEKKLSFIGVTGTDGKTTTSMMLWNLLDNFVKTAYMGTNGLFFKDEVSKLSNTTPEPSVMYNHFEDLSKKGCQYVAMEVASEALLHGRVDGLKMKYTILTNITEDHLDIHGSLENYVLSKKKLFYLMEDEGKVILNIDDKHYETIVKDLHNEVYTYGVNENADFCIKNVNNKNGFTTFDICHKEEIYSFESPYIGLYNVYNLTASIAVLLLEGYDYGVIKEKVKKLITIPGRGEVLNFGQKYMIVLDYAHTTNGVHTILESIRNYNFKRVITVIGSAGGRQKDKRAHMGRLALEASDYVIFTMDDPRNESVDSIIDDLISDSVLENYTRINDRKEAIYYALSIAKEDDIVLVLGKGRDTYMAIGNEKIDYCDYNIIEEYFK